ncbi:hypothetical protein EDB85DRAFT_1970679 [Lactarius pseudohatsudake]|nr:hypothetical protein EDB85DRAFT_1970679 [Lactarius pseudohatsudake]
MRRVRNTVSPLGPIAAATAGGPPVLCGNPWNGPKSTTLRPSERVTASLCWAGIHANPKSPLMSTTHTTRARAGPSPSIHASDSYARRLAVVRDVPVCVRALAAQPRALRGLVCLHFHRPCAVSLSNSDTLQRLLELRLGTACELARLLEANKATDHAPCCVVMDGIDEKKAGYKDA